MIIKREAEKETEEKSNEVNSDYHLSPHNIARSKTGEDLDFVLFRRTNVLHAIMMMITEQVSTILTVD